MKMMIKAQARIDFNQVLKLICEEKDIKSIKNQCPNSMSYDQIQNSPSIKKLSNDDLIKGASKTEEYETLKTEVIQLLKHQIKKENNRTKVRECN